eukprot:538179_1
MKKNKSKFLLSTRNDFTGKAINTLDNISIKELFNGKSSYIHWENKYLQRRFYGDDGKSPTSRDTNDILVQQRFEKFCTTHNGNKPLLILDVDNTMLYVRFFSDEMRINDTVTYFGDSHFRNNGKVLKLQKTLHLEIINGQLIDKLGQEHVEICIWIDDNDTLEKYKKRATYDYKPDDLSYNIQCEILRTEVTGCIIQVKYDNIIEEEEYDSNEYNCIPTQTIEDIEISFVDENEHLCKLEPTLNRPGMLPVDFIYEGFLVRLRPDLDEFLEYISEDFDIVIFTAAIKEVYNGMLAVLHEYIKEQLGRDDENDLKLWTDVLFRNDCVVKNEKRIKPYHHKDLTLFGCHLSRTVMIDNSPIVVSGQEPNVILIADFFGKDQVDDQFMEIYSLLDTVKDINGDIRYFLCDIESPNDDKKLDLLTKESCKKITIEFIDLLKKDFKHNKKRSVSMSQSKRHSFSADNIPIFNIKSDPNIPQHIYAVSAQVPTLPRGNSTPMHSKWMDKYNKRKELLRSKFKKKHRSLLTIDTGKLGVKRHSLYSSMSPKIQDSTNFDICASYDDDDIGIMNMDIIEHQQINNNDYDNKFDFDNNIDYGDITDQEEDDDEYMLINPTISKSKSKNKNTQVKFTNMTSLEIKQIHQDNGKNDTLYTKKSDTKPLRIEFAIIDDDDDEKILLKPDEKLQNVMNKYRNGFNDNLDEEKINVINESNGNSMNEPLITVDLNDDNDGYNKDLNDNNDKKKRKKKLSRAEKEMNEENGFCNDNFISRFFC